MNEFREEGGVPKEALSPHDQEMMKVNNPEVSEADEETGEALLEQYGVESKSDLLEFEFFGDSSLEGLAKAFADAEKKYGEGNVRVLEEETDRDGNVVEGLVGIYYNEKLSQELEEAA